MEEKALIESLIHKFYTFFSNKDVGEYLIDVSVKFVFRVLICFILYKITKKLVVFFCNRLSHLDSTKKLDKSFVSFLISMTKFASYAFLVVIILRIFGVSSVSIAALSGGAGVGIGFAIKDILSNFAGGAILLAFKPFKVGDFVEVNDISGEVSAISIFSTEMNSIDHKKIFVPNGSIVTNKIINYSANKVRRVEIIFGIAYKDDFRKAMHILKEIAESHDKVLQNIEKTIRVKDLGDSSVNIMYRVWCKNEDFWSVYFDSTELAKEAFDRAGISIPFPQMDVHLKNDHTDDEEKVG